jgi:hypothetical protein
MKNKLAALVMLLGFIYIGLRYPEELSDEME